VAVLEARNVEEATVERMGMAQSAFGGSLESGGRFFFCCFAWQKSGFTRREDVLHFIYSIKKCYAVCTWSEN
jgi:hypothetical protein